MSDCVVHVGSPTGAEVSPRIFGGHVEHGGRLLYGGIWDLARGCPRPDVAAAVRALGLTVLRYPGGCFADWYHWRDGVGPVAERPYHERTFWTDIAPDPEWGRFLGPPEPNAFGTDEFLRYCVDVDAQPLLTANFAAADPQEAADWVSYCNRRPESPRPVHWWGIGNETYGPWEPGHCPPEDYGERFVEYADAMRRVDPSVRLLAVGSDSGEWFTDWNSRMLAKAGELVDAVSLHYYFPGLYLGRDLADTEDEFTALLSGSQYLGEWLDRNISEIDRAAPGRRLPVTLDEWNLWSSYDQLRSMDHRLCDTVFFAGCLNRLIERAGRVTMAMNQVVTGMSPIQASDDRIWVTASYLTLALYRRYLRRAVRVVAIEAPRVVAPELPAVDTAPPQLGGVLVPRREVSVLDAAATSDESGTTVYLSCGFLTRPMSVEVTGLPRGASGRARWVDGPDAFARNDADHPNRLGYAERALSVDDQGRCRLRLHPATVTALIVGLGPSG